MIINTGCRTDIPAFYSKWLINRIKEGYVYVRNPYYPSQVTKYRLNPDVVDCLEFCTKNPEPMIKYLSDLDKYGQYWFVTITPYGEDFEPNVPNKEEVIKSFKTLSEHVGINCIGWRYDPIFINNEFDIYKHIEEFEKMAEKIKGYTNGCTISFLDIYEKVKRNAPDIRPPTKEEQIELAKNFVGIGKKNNISIYSCCEGSFLSEYGVNCDGCVSQEIIERAIGSKLVVPKINNIRKDCNCLLGNDIGMYNTCGHLCKYCYANANSRIVKVNMKMHIETSPFLIGREMKGDKITEAKQSSWKAFECEQTTLW